MRSADLAVCVDFGSTFTKASLVDLAAGRIIGAAEHRTTIETDVLDGYDACLAALVAQDSRAADAEVLACSSAGGGLRIAVVGNEELVTAEAGRRVALSSGGRVVEVVAAASLTRPLVAGGSPTRPQVAGGSAATRPLVAGGSADVVLLTGGTDGGNSEVLLRAARELVESGWRGPVVVAANVASQGELAGILHDVPHVLTDNVVPRIGVLEPAPARAAIREVFLRHVIGGKHLSSRADPSTGSGHRFTAMVRGATPDVVLTGVEMLARGLDEEHPGAGDVVVLDIGGATTDVHSVVDVDPEDGAVDADGLAREVVAPTPVTRTVEGDLGMRWSAVSTVEAADAPGLAAAARRRREEPGFLPTTPAEHDEDEAIAGAAVGLALRRHAGRSRVVTSPEGRVVERSGVDLREVDLLVGSGGVLRHGRAGIADRVLGPMVGEHGDWQVPRRPRMVIDHDYVLAAAGLLAGPHPRAAYRLVRTLLEPTGTSLTE